MGSKLKKTRRRLARKARKAARPARSEGAKRFQSRRVVLLLKDGFDLARERMALTKRYGPIALRSVFNRSRARIQRLQARAEKGDPRYSLPNLLNYHFLFLPSGREPEEVVRELRDHYPVAYVDAPTQNASGSKAKCSCSSHHIEGTGEGVNAQAAWTYAGGKGDGQFLVDVERGWAEDHVRLPTPTITRLVGDSIRGGRSHGTSVLGILCGQHVAGGGCEGIAPNVAAVGLASPVPEPKASASGAQVQQGEPLSDEPENLYHAIAVGMDELVRLHDLSPSEGYGVLLVEQQTELGFPVETYQGIQDLLILVTTGHKITVVEAAGNAGKDLDVEAKAQTLRQRDSGAILVGSAYSKVTTQPLPDHHVRYHTSNFGGRVDCYAWGEFVATPVWESGGQPGPLGIRDRCDVEFAETSAAAAIIAGAALSVQGIVARLGKSPLGAAQLRDILTNRALGTPCAVNDRIGVMPDLGRIAPTL